MDELHSEMFKKQFITFVLRKYKIKNKSVVKNLISTL